MKFFYYLVFVIVISACSVETKTTKKPTSGTSDGTASAPAELTVGTAKSGGVAYMGDSYYKFTTSSAGSYNLAIDSMVITETTSSYGVSTILYSNSGLTTSSRMDSDSCGASCTLYFDYENLDANKTYYLNLSAWGTITYSLTVYQGGSEGSKINPVELTLGTVHYGRIDNIDSTWVNGYSYYKFTTASADNYTLTITNSDSLDCTLYSNSAFSTKVSNNYNNCTAGTNLSDNFTGTSSSAGLSVSTAYYLRIEGMLTTVKTSTYNITVAAEGN